jgi:hypothetical protein
VTGTPVNNVADVTPPPTDTSRTVRSGSDGWRLIVLGLAALVAAAVTLDATRSSVARARRSRRH